jgi:hypothetical protein
VGVNASVKRGDPVGLEFDAHQVTLFDQAGGRAIRTARDDDAVSVPASRGAVHG